MCVYIGGGEDDEHRQYLASYLSMLNQSYSSCMPLSSHKMAKIKVKIPKKKPKKKPHHKL